MKWLLQMTGCALMIIAGLIIIAFWVWPIYVWVREILGWPV